MSVPPGRIPHLPSLTVVAVVHERTQFIEGALRSALEQTLPPERFDIVVVGNRLEDSLRTRFPGDRIEFIDSDEPALGAKVATGLRHARGEIVAFLEDDDRFEPSKLEGVSARFAGVPGLGFYHNNFRLVGADERPWTGPFHRAAAARRIRRRGRVDVPAGVPAPNWLDFQGLFPGFNNSCISVRRSALLPWTDWIARSGLITDECLFLAAAASGSALLQDDAPLTRIMVHGASISSPTGLDPRTRIPELAAFSQANLASRRALADLARASGRPDLIGLVEGETAVQQIIGGLRSSRTPRGEFGAPLRGVLRHLDTLAVRNFPEVLPLSALAMLSPPAAHWVYSVGKQVSG